MLRLRPHVLAIIAGVRAGKAGFDNTHDAEGRPGVRVRLQLPISYITRGVYSVEGLEEGDGAMEVHSYVKLARLFFISI